MKLLSVFERLSVGKPMYNLFFYNANIGMVVDGDRARPVQTGERRVESEEMGQVEKGTRWMPWHLAAMKDVGACDKPRRAGKQALTRGSPNGETHSGSFRCIYRQTRGIEPS